MLGAISFELDFLFLRYSKIVIARAKRCRAPIPWSYRAVGGERSCLFANKPGLSMGCAFTRPHPYDMEIPMWLRGRSRIRSSEGINLCVASLIAIYVIGCQYTTSLLLTWRQPPPAQNRQPWNVGPPVRLSFRIDIQPHFCTGHIYHCSRIRAQVRALRTSVKSRNRTKRLKEGLW